MHTNRHQHKSQCYTHAHIESTLLCQKENVQKISFGEILPETLQCINTLAKVQESFFEMSEKLKRSLRRWLEEVDLLTQVVDWFQLIGSQSVEGSLLCFAQLISAVFAFCDVLAALTSVPANSAVLLWFDAHAAECSAAYLSPEASNGECISEVLRCLGPLISVAHLSPVMRSSFTLWVPGSSTTQWWLPQFS